MNITVTEPPQANITVTEAGATITVVEQVATIIEADGGPQGPAGAPGPAGQDGAPGPQGPVGTQRWYGSGPPTVVIGAAVGDEYLDIDSGDLYVLGEI